MRWWFVFRCVYVEIMTLGIHHRLKQSNYGKVDLVMIILRFGLVSHLLLNLISNIDTIEGGLYNIVVNASLFSDPTNAQLDYEEHLRWLEEKLKEYPFKGFEANAIEGSPVHVLLFQHQPWFLEKPDDADDYFTIPKVRRQPVLELLREAKVRAVLAGHYHRNAYGTDGDLT